MTDTTTAKEIHDFVEIQDIQGSLWIYCKTCGSKCLILDGRSDVDKAKHPEHPDAFYKPTHFNQ